MKNYRKEITKRAAEIPTPPSRPLKRKPNPIGRTLVENFEGEVSDKNGEYSFKTDFFCWPKWVGSKKYGKYEIESVEFLNFHAGKKNPDNEFDEIVNPQELRNVQGLIWENLYTDILSLVERKKSEG
jgi:hypothetical protein